MKQTLDKQKEKEKSSTLVEEVKQQAKAMKPLTRWVRVEYKDCCGCGCNWESVYREVPYDSDLTDGSRVSGLQKGDTANAPKGHPDYE